VPPRSCCCFCLCFCFCELRAASCSELAAPQLPLLSSRCLGGAAPGRPPLGRQSTASAQARPANTISNLLAACRQTGLLCTSQTGVRLSRRPRWIGRPNGNRSPVAKLEAGDSKLEGRPPATFHWSVCAQCSPLAAGQWPTSSRNWPRKPSKRAAWASPERPSGLAGAPDTRAGIKLDFIGRPRVVGHEATITGPPKSADNNGPGRSNWCSSWADLWPKFGPKIFAHTTKATALRSHCPIGRFLRPSHSIRSGPKVAANERLAPASRLHYLAGASGPNNAMGPNGSPKGRRVLLQEETSGPLKEAEKCAPTLRVGRCCAATTTDSLPPPFGRQSSQVEEFFTPPTRPQGRPPISLGPHKSRPQLLASNLCPSMRAQTTMRPTEDTPDRQDRRQDRCQDCLFWLARNVKLAKRQSRPRKGQKRPLLASCGPKIGLRSADRHRARHHRDPKLRLSFGRLFPFHFHFPLRFPFHFHFRFHFHHL